MLLPSARECCICDLHMLQCTISQVKCCAARCTASSYGLLAQMGAQGLYHGTKSRTTDTRIFSPPPFIDLVEFLANMSRLCRGPPNVRAFRQPMKLLFRPDPGSAYASVCCSGVRNETLDCQLKCDDLDHVDLRFPLRRARWLPCGLKRRILVATRMRAFPSSHSSSSPTPLK